MLNKIIQFSLRNRLAILVAALLICIGGVYTALTMEVDVFPDLNAPTVVVMTEARGMAPEEVERIVTFPIETAMNGATHVRRVRSSSTTGFSCVWVEFDWGTDIYLDRQIVNEKLAEVSTSLPSTVGQPTLGPQSSILGEVMIIGLTGGDPQQLRTLADWTLRPRLLSIGGVAQVSVQGGEEKEYQVTLHPERMKYHGISVDEAVDAVRDMNQNVSGGVLYEYGNEYLIRGALATNDVEELGQTVVKVVDGSPVTLNEFADIKVGNKTPKTGTASNNAQPAVLLTVAKQPNVSTEELTSRLDNALDEIQRQLPEGVKVDSQIFRQERFIDASISNIKESLIEGAIFVIIVLFLFLMNPRTTIISLVSIPVSLLVGILSLRYMGLTINTMSIGGMAIAIGSLVDDAIVDVENVYRRLREVKSEKLKVIYEASREVRMPILNSTLIVVVCFLPLFFLDGMEGRMLAPLGIAFIVSLFASTMVALTLTPVLCSYFLHGAVSSGSSASSDSATDVDGMESGDVRWIASLKRVYASMLRRALCHRRSILSAVAVFVVVAVVFFANMGRSFLPSFNEGSYTISLSTLPGISLEESDKIGRRAEQLLMSIPEIQTVARKTGRAELDEHAFGVNTSEIEAPFELKDRSRAELMAEVRQKLSTLSGVSIEIGQPISHRIDAMLSGTQANIAIKLFGQDLNRMYRLANEIKMEIHDVEGIADLNVEQQVERPQIRISPRRHLMARYGVTPRQFADYVSVLLEGETVSQVYEGTMAFDLTVKVDDEDRRGIEDIRSLMIDANGKKIPLSYIAEITSTTGPNTINRENAQRKIVISANVEGRDLRGVVNEVQARINERVHLPEGYHLEYGGQFESEESATRTLLMVSLLSVLIIFLLLNNQFHSIKQSAIVLVNLPLALIGGVFALQITGGVLSIPAIIGFISLFGIATRNGILLIDRFNQTGDVIQGSLDRMTPILMTALTSALALVPLAIGGDLPGNEIQSPMAKVMLGGLISSTLLNMFVVPMMWKPKK
ncbi:MAG: efflux RND transporter permease subunit [Bacteroidaceae bacterium]|nr:efflux RND transporter permease subunit [Bacteroidaceae bacterium]